MPAAKLLIHNANQTVASLLALQNGAAVSGGGSFFQKKSSLLFKQIAQETRQFSSISCSGCGNLQECLQRRLKAGSHNQGAKCKQQHQCSLHSSQSLLRGSSLGHTTTATGKMVSATDSKQHQHSSNIRQQQTHSRRHHLSASDNINKQQARLLSTTRDLQSTAKIIREASTQAFHRTNLESEQEQDQHQQQQINHQQTQQQQNWSDKRIKPSFKASEIQINLCKPHELKHKPVDANNLTFGHNFTDYMFRCDWDRDAGWSVPSISKISNIDLHPAAKVFHYATATFEGIKVFRGDDDSIRFFRLDRHINRLYKSSQRISLPIFDQQELIDCIHKLVEIDQDWVPESKGNQLNALYIRPTIIGVEESLGVAASKKASLFVLLSPVSAYFKTGFKPVTLFADKESVRAWPGGVGMYKLGSNYAPTTCLQEEAEKRGFQQVLWLFGEDLKLTEVGTMNIFVVYKKTADSQRFTVVTPPLDDGLILPGITRNSIIQLLKEWNDVEVEERYPTFGEIQKMADEKRLVEMFGSGTACIVCPISLIQLKDGPTINIPYQDVTLSNANSDNFNKGASANFTCLSKRILKSITDIQYGRVKHPWAQELK